MADYNTTVAKSTWTALPVPSEAVTLQCQMRPIRLTVRANLSGAVGIILHPGQVVNLTAGQAAWVRADTLPGGTAVMEAVG